jgi:hypothetical protein
MRYFTASCTRRLRPTTKSTVVAAAAKARVAWAAKAAVNGGSSDEEVDDGGKGSGGGDDEVKGGGDDYKVFPRRKVGRSSHVPGERAPVVLTEDKLRECFDLPLHVASKKMGICITAIKKVRSVLDFLYWATY